ncbi:hypothetical protein HZ326_25474 [Fusarium oxysporum f. sp. albedinis]|nr:hypothetical protein HZ326_25474 [Fusarium oxysporum f. sp. albedinis]
MQLASKKLGLGVVQKGEGGLESSRGMMKFAKHRYPAESRGSSQGGGGSAGDKWSRRKAHAVNCCSGFGALSLNHR